MEILKSDPTAKIIENKNLKVQTRTGSGPCRCMQVPEHQLPSCPATCKGSGRAGLHPGGTMAALRELSRHLVSSLIWGISNSAVAMASECGLLGFD